MDSPQKEQQKLYKECWKKCKSYHDMFVDQLNITGLTEDKRRDAVTAYVKKVKPFFDEYYAKLKEIGYDLFTQAAKE